MAKTRRYSFLSPPMEALLSCIEDILPGCKLAQVHYFNADRGRLTSRLWSGGTVEPLFPDAPAKTRIQKLRNGRKGWHWLHDRQLNVTESVLLEPQLTLEDEQHNRLLLIRLAGDDGQHDLLVLSLSNEWSDFGPARQGDHLRTGDKSVIGKLLFKTFDFLHKQYIRDRRIHESLARMMAHKEQRLQNDEKNDEQHRRMHLDLVASFVQNMLDKASEEEGVQFDFSPKAMDKVASFSGSIEQLATLVSTAVITSLNLYPAGSGPIVINEDHIVFTNQQASSAIHCPEDKYEKTRQLLNRYEEAARYLLENGKKITGINIGRYCKPKCSPAAISDVLKNHRNKMMSLFRKYPELWPILRSHFRPVANISEHLKAS